MLNYNDELHDAEEHEFLTHNGIRFTSSNIEQVHRVRSTVILFKTEMKFILDVIQIIKLALKLQLPRGKNFRGDKIKISLVQITKEKKLHCLLL